MQHLLRSVASLQCLTQTRLGIYANPDFGLIEDYVTHARKCYTRDPFNSSVTLVLPIWTDRPWWRKLKGFQVLAHYAAGSELFTSPPSGVDSGAAPASRVSLGPTRWGLIIVHLPSARRSLGHRGVGREGHGAGDPHQREPRGVLPTLCGHSAQDMFAVSNVCSSCACPAAGTLLSPRRPLFCVPRAALARWPATRFPWRKTRRASAGPFSRGSRCRTTPCSSTSSVQGRAPPSGTG